MHLIQGDLFFGLPGEDWTVSTFGLRPLMLEGAFKRTRKPRLGQVLLYRNLWRIGDRASQLFCYICITCMDLSTLG